MEAGALLAGADPKMHYALGVLPWSVVHAGDGWLAVECGVAAVVVVGVEEVCQGFGAFGVAGVRPLVGPFVEQGAVEAFDLAVGLRPVGPYAFVGDAGRCEGLGEQLGLVAGAVVGQDPFDGDAVGLEEGWARCQKAAAVCRRSSVRTSL